MIFKTSNVMAVAVVVLGWLSATGVQAASGGEAKEVESPLMWALSALGKPIPGFPVPIKGWQIVVLLVFIANFFISASGGRGPSVVASHILVKEKSGEFTCTFRGAVLGHQV